MKIKLKAEMIDGKGKVITQEIETEVPEVKEFGNPENFYDIFDRFERPVIEAGNQIKTKMAETYLEEAVKASKKGAEQETVKLKEKSEESK